MTVFPVPPESYLKDRFEIRVSTGHVAAYPLYVTDTGTVAADNLVIGIAYRDSSVGFSDAWLDFSDARFDSRNVPDDLPHDVQQAVDAAIALARLAESRGYR